MLDKRDSGYHFQGHPIIGTIYDSIADEHEQGSAVTSQLLARAEARGITLSPHALKELAIVATTRKDMSVSLHECPAFV